MSLLLPLQPLRCSREDCTLPQGGRCAREAEFSDPEAACPELARATDAGAPVKLPSEHPEPDAEGGRMEGVPAPWAGRHLPIDEARRLLLRSPARLIAVLGAHDAGKTSLLASFFLQLANGQRPGFPYRFAASRSLFGFRDLVERAKRYRGAKGEQVVDHTPQTESGDVGRLLHLGFRPDNDQDNRLVDVLLTDLPGEWITDWANMDDDALDRRMPLLRRASGFVVVVDAEALLAPGGRSADAMTAQLIQRITDVVKGGNNPGLSLVVSKVDRILERLSPPMIEHAEEQAAWGPLGKRFRAIWPALERAKSRGLDVKVFPTSAFPGPLDALQPVNVVQPFAHVLRCADRRERWSFPVAEIPLGATYFQCVRRWGNSA